MARVMFTDVKDGVIENKVVMTSFFVFLGYTGIANGTQGLIYAGKMCAITFVVLFVFYLIKAIGAGDVKMLSVLGILLPEAIWSIVTGALVVTAGYGVIRMLKRGICHEKIYVKGETVPFSIPVGVITAGVLLQECIV